MKHTIYQDSYTQQCFVPNGNQMCGWPKILHLQYVTGFEITRLPHTQQVDILFTITQ